MSVLLVCVSVGLSRNLQRKDYVTRQTNDIAVKGTTTKWVREEGARSLARLCRHKFELDWMTISPKLKACEL